MRKEPSRKAVWRPASTGAGTGTADIGTEPGRRNTVDAPLVAGVPLGSITPREFVDDPHLVMLARPNSALAEHYRRIASKLAAPDRSASKPLQVIVVSSAVPDEGKTTTALNVVLALAEGRDRSALLVDGDLRAGGVGKLLKPAPKFGFSEVLAGTVPLEHALLDIRLDDKGSRLTLLPAGTAVKNPTELLQSRAVATTLDELRRRYDYIVLDTPPVLPFTDTVVLGHHADGVLLVVRASSTPKPVIQKALELIRAEQVVGTVLNDVKISLVDRAYYRYYGYESASSRSKGRRS